MNIAAILNAEFDHRRGKNRRYSLRSFAKFLSMDATALSRIMNGTRLPTYSTSIALLKKLGLEGQYSQEEVKRSLETTKHQPNQLTNAFDASIFENLFESKHLYVLAALRLNTYSLAQIKARLLQNCGIRETEFQQIIADLQNIGAVIKTENGIEPVYKNKSTLPLPFTSEKRRSLQKEFLSGGIKAIDDIPFDERENATLTLSLRKKDWPQVKAILKEARVKINKLSEKNGSAEGVYNICMAAYPVLSID